MNNENKPGLLVALVIYSVISSFGLLSVSAFTALAAAMPFIPTTLSVVMTILSVTHLAFGVALLASSYGIWTLQKWGWQLSITAFSVSIFLGLVAILPLAPDSTFSVSNLIFQLFFVVIDILCIRYLMQYEIKRLLHVFPYL